MNGSRRMMLFQFVLKENYSVLYIQVHSGLRVITEHMMIIPTIMIARGIGMKIIRVHREFKLVDIHMAGVVWIRL